MGREQLIATDHQIAGVNINSRIFSATQTIHMSRDNSPVREKKAIKKVFLLNKGDLYEGLTTCGVFYEIEIARAAAEELMSNDIRPNKKWEKRHPNEWRRGNSDSICIEEANICKTMQEWKSERSTQNFCGAYDCYETEIMGCKWCTHNPCNVWICQECSGMKRTLCEEHRK